MAQPTDSRSARAPGRGRPVDPAEISARLGEDGALAVRAAEEAVDAYDAFVLVRALSPRGDADVQFSVYRALEEAGALVINRLGALLDAQDKFRTSQLLLRAGVATPAAALVQTPAEAAAVARSWGDVCAQAAGRLVGRRGRAAAEGARGRGQGRPAGARGRGPLRATMGPQLPGATFGCWSSAGGRPARWSGWRRPGSSGPTSRAVRALARPSSRPGRRARRSARHGRSGSTTEAWTSSRPAGRTAGHRGQRDPGVRHDPRGDGVRHGGGHRAPRRGSRERAARAGAQALGDQHGGAEGGRGREPVRPEFRGTGGQWTRAGRRQWRRARRRAATRAA